MMQEGNIIKIDLSIKLGLVFGYNFLNKLLRHKSFNRPHKVAAGPSLATT